MVDHFFGFTASLGRPPLPRERVDHDRRTLRGIRAIGKAKVAVTREGDRGLGIRRPNHAQAIHEMRFVE